MGDQSNRNKVSISHSQGMVIGEHNLIYQYFQVPEHARMASKYIGFQPLIENKTEGFVGRQFVFDALYNFIQKHRSGYFLIIGEPGIGKTALSAQLVKRHGFPHHFNVAPQNIRSPRQFLGNACAQLIARYDLSHEFIPEDATGDSIFLVQCLNEAAANHENRPVILLVDALDESERLGLPPRVNTLYLPPVLPEGAYIVLTSRPVEDMKLQVANQKILYLEPDSEGNLLDVQDYIESYLRKDKRLQSRINVWKKSPNEFIRALVEKSEGNFIYLYYVLPAISKGKFKQDSVEELPQGLRAYYRSHWDLMQISDPDEFERVFAPIVCMLAVVSEPVTLDQLQHWTTINIVHIRRAITQWREFLEEEAEGDGYKYRVYHTSFQDFLGKMVDLNRFREMITRYYLQIKGL